MLSSAGTVRVANATGLDELFEFLEVWRLKGMEPVNDKVEGWQSSLGSFLSLWLAFSYAFLSLTTAVALGVSLALRTEPPLPAFVILTFMTGLTGVIALIFWRLAK